MNTALGELSLLSNLKYHQMMLKDPPSYCVELYHRDNCFYVSEKLKLNMASGYTHARGSFRNGGGGTGMSGV